MQVSGVASATRGDAFGEHFDDGVEVDALEIAIWIGAATVAKSSFSSQSSAEHMATICCARMSSGASGIIEAVEVALLDGAHQRGAFEKFVARGDEDAALGNRAAPVPGTADAL